MTSSVVPALWPMTYTDLCIGQTPTPNPRVTMPMRQLFGSQRILARTGKMRDWPLRSMLNRCVGLLIVGMSTGAVLAVDIDFQRAKERISRLPCMLSYDAYLVRQQHQGKGGNDDELIRGYLELARLPLHEYMRLLRWSREVDNFRIVNGKEPAGIPRDAYPGPSSLSLRVNMLACLMFEVEEPGLYQPWDFRGGVLRYRPFQASGIGSQAVASLPRTSWSYFLHLRRRPFAHPAIGELEGA
ncbi:MAG: hypothetical protein HONBIEJF_02593 [Fimbriimonadaceae bacterium]|nr:hypothetical protein [Fimbriimonadaceae bacterium]